MVLWLRLLWWLSLRVVTIIILYIDSILYIPYITAIVDIYQYIVLLLSYKSLYPNSKYWWPTTCGNKLTTPSAAARAPVPLPGKSMEISSRVIPILDAKWWTKIGIQKVTENPDWWTCFWLFPIKKKRWSYVLIRVYNITRTPDLRSIKEALNPLLRNFMISMCCIANCWDVVWCILAMFIQQHPEKYKAIRQPQVANSWAPKRNGRRFASWFSSERERERDQHWC